MHHYSLKTTENNLNAQQQNAQINCDTVTQWEEVAMEKTKNLLCTEQHGHIPPHNCLMKEARHKSTYTSWFSIVSNYCTVSSFMTALYYLIALQVRSVGVALQ
jgi:hypothetical protein